MEIPSFHLGAKQLFVQYYVKYWTQELTFTSGGIPMHGKVIKIYKDI